MRFLTAFIVAFIVAYLCSRYLFKQIDFHYATLSEPFDINKLLIDIGAFVLFYLPVYFLYGKMKGKHLSVADS